MKKWTPQKLYDAKPWAFIALGVCTAVGATIWAYAAGEWTGLQGALCLGGAALAILGAAILQTRREYRSRSKWQRERFR